MYIASGVAIVENRFFGLNYMTEREMELRVRALGIVVPEDKLMIRRCTESNEPVALATKK
jgi:hypothetical protein